MKTPPYKNILLTIIAITLVWAVWELRDHQRYAFHNKYPIILDTKTGEWHTKSTEPNSIKKDTILKKS